MEGTLDFDYSIYALLNHELLHSMQQLFIQGKQMMSVSDEEIEAYRKERERLKADMEDREKNRQSTMETVMQLQREINAARERIK